jgi:hypothetical protein
MFLSQSTRPNAFMIERDVSLAATAGTTVGISVPAGTTVLAAGFENYTRVPDVTTYTLDVTDGTTVFANDLNFDNAAANTNRGGVVPGFIAAADTIDVVTTITGSPGVIAGRVWAVVVDCSKGAQSADEVDRDQLA